MKKMPRAHFLASFRFVVVSMSTAPKRSGLASPCKPRARSSLDVALAALGVWGSVFSNSASLGACTLSIESLDRAAALPEDVHGDIEALRARLEPQRIHENQFLPQLRVGSLQGNMTRPKTLYGL